MLEIYRIVSNKALESSNDVIRPTGGETIVVSQSLDDQKQGGKCC
jgi:Ras-related protein Rab-11A